MKKYVYLLLSFLVLLALSSCGNSHIHQYQDTVIEPTCTNIGYTLHICTTCQYSYQDTEREALGHLYESRIEDAACNQHTTTVYTCQRCQDFYSEGNDEFGSIHSYQTTVVYPDRQTGGYTLHQCKYCDTSYTENYTDPVDFSVGLAYTTRSGKTYVSGIGSCREKDITIHAVSDRGETV